MTPPPPARIDTLTSLRFFCALLVVVHHAPWAFQTAWLRVLYARYLWFGFTGVSFFFILSGFVLTHAAQGRRTSLSGFYLRRMQRIYPLHLATLLAAIPLVVAGGGIDSFGHFLWRLVLNICLLQAWAPDSQVYFSLNSPSWSLSVEVLFDALFPFLVVRSSAEIRCLAALFLVLPQTLLLHAGATAHFSDYVFPLSRLPEFCIGILCCRLADRIAFPSAAAASVLECFAVASIVLAAGTAHLLDFDITAALWFLPPCAFAIVIFSRQAGFISRGLRWRPLIRLGEASFALYMLHQLVFRCWDMFLRPHFPTIQERPCALFLVLLTASVVLAVIVTESIEKPVSRHLHRHCKEPPAESSNRPPPDVSSAAVLPRSGPFTRVGKSERIIPQQTGGGTGHAVL